jgi:hypothetical protein
MTNEKTTDSAASALSAGLGEMTHFWCEVCDAIQPAFFEGALHHSTADDFVGGDVVCSVCAFIVATAYTPNAELRPKEIEHGTVFPV